MSIDDAVNNVPEEEVRKEAKRYNPFYSPIANLTLAAALLFTSAVAVPKARADGYDLKDKIGTEQVQNEIDLSQYTKLDVEGTQGIDVYVSKIRRNPNDWDSVVEKDYAQKWIKYAYFFDLYIHNNSENGITLDREIIKSLTGKASEREIKSEEFLKWYMRYSNKSDKVYIPAKGDIFLPDNGYMTGDSNKKIMITFYGKNDSNSATKIAFPIKIN